MPRVMFTNGNDVHPADYHAEVTAGKIIEIVEHASAATAPRDLRKAIEAILTSHHTDVGSDENAQIKQHGLDRLNHPLDASPHIDNDLMTQIINASKGTIMESTFARGDVQTHIVGELHHETRSQMNVHRLVFAEADRLAKAVAAPKA